MTKEEILAMEAGEKLDCLVAKEVMGEPKPSRWTPRNALELQLAGNPAMSKGENWVCLCRHDEGDIPIWRPVPFSTDISVAWQVVEKMEKLGFYFKLDSWQVEFYASGRDMDKNVVKFDGLTSKLVCSAICKAALITKLEVKE